MDLQRLRMKTFKKTVVNTDRKKQNKKKKENKTTPSSDQLTMDNFLINRHTTSKEDKGQMVKLSDRKNTISDTVKDNTPTLSEEDKVNMKKKIRNLSVKKTFDKLSQLRG